MFVSVKSRCPPQLESHNKSKWTNSQVGIIADSLGPNFADYCEEIMKELYTNLNDVKKRDDLDRKVKVSIIRQFGDIALNMAGGFQKYLPHILPILQQAAITIDIPDDFLDHVEYIDYVNDLREAVRDYLNHVDCF